MIEKIREEARKALREKKADIIIGFEEGSLRPTPAFIEREEDVDRLIWNSFCDINLATFIRKFKGKKIGIIAKGCDSRAIMVLISEKQIRREDLYIIGVPCQGMVDRKRFKKEPKEIKPEDLYENCQDCNHRNPVVYDVLVGEKVEEGKGEYPDIKKMEELSSDERWEFFNREIDKCIRCYACREACPMCYCEECFVDSNLPRWLEPGIELSDLRLWHLIRAFHLAGRCVDCGACEHSCPMDVKILHLTRRQNRDIKQLYKFETGIKEEATMPLATFSLDDKEEIFL